MFRAALSGEERGEQAKRQRAGVGGNLFTAGEVTQPFGTQSEVQTNFSMRTPNERWERSNIPGK